MKIGLKYQLNSLEKQKTAEECMKIINRSDLTDSQKDMLIRGVAIGNLMALLLTDTFATMRGDLNERKMVFRQRKK